MYSQAEDAQNFGVGQQENVNNRWMQGVKKS